MQGQLFFSCLRKSLLGWIVAMLMAVCAPAQAAIFCVGTETALRNALLSAQANTDAANFIYIQEGTINITGSTGNDGPIYDDPTGNKSLVIFGHRNGTCSALGGETILDAGGNTNLLAINNPHGSVAVQGVTFLQGDSKNQIFSAAALSAVGASVSLRLSTFIANHSASSVNIHIVAGYSLYAVNNLFLGNTGAGYGAGLLTTTNSAGATYIVGNTLVNNHNTGNSSKSYGVAVGGGTGTFYLSNNILWGTTATSGTPYDLLSGGAVQVHNNDIGSHDGDAWDPSSSGNLSVDPGFVPGFFSVKLAPDSPLANAGIDSPPGGQAGANSNVDLGYQPRIVGAHIDIGAYESDVLFRSGFE